MGYASIKNLYKQQDILLFKECYAMEKIHGSSGSITLYIVEDKHRLDFFSGGNSDVKFMELFDKELLVKELSSLSFGKIVIYGEVYGGKIHKMSDTYGPDMRFVVFDVCVTNENGIDRWLDVPDAEEIAKRINLEFVHYVKIPATIDEVDKQKNADSVQSVRNGMGPQMREGVVLRPLKELVDSFGERVISKHKRDEFGETAKARPIVDTKSLTVLEDAIAIANEWVTENRLSHVLQKIDGDHNMSIMQKVIIAMREDVLKESKGEIKESKEALNEIGKRTVQLYKAWLTKK